MQIFDDETLIWTKVVKNKQIEIYKRKTPDSPAIIVKAIALVENNTC